MQPLRLPKKVGKNGEQTMSSPQGTGKHHLGLTSISAGHARVRTKSSEIGADSPISVVLWSVWLVIAR